PAIGIAEHAVADTAAEKLMDRNGKRLPQNVPAGDLDRRDHGAVDVAAVKRDAVEHALGERAHAPRILSNGEMLEFANAGLRRADEAVQRPLAYPVQSLIGVDPDEQPVLPAGANGECLDAGDAHGSGEPGDGLDDTLGREAVHRLQMGHRTAFDVAIGQTDAGERPGDTAVEQRFSDKAGEATDPDVVLRRYNMVDRRGEIGGGIGIEGF